MLDRRWTDELIRRLAGRMKTDEQTASDYLEAFIDVVAQAFRSKDEEVVGQDMKGPALQALTPEAKVALDSDLVSVDRFPFRVGREGRYQAVLGESSIRDRRNGQQAPNNDLYLFDQGKKMYVSREHFLINRKMQGAYELVDLGSRLGTIVSGRVLGPKKSDNSCILRDGDVIFIGGAYSPIVVKFVMVALR